MMKLILMAATSAFLSACALGDDEDPGRTYDIEVCTSRCPAPVSDSTKYDGLGVFTPDHDLIRCIHTDIAYECVNPPF